MKDVSSLINSLNLGNIKFGLLKKKIPKLFLNTRSLCVPSLLAQHIMFLNF